MVWVAATWTIWSCRNHIIFRGGLPTVGRIVQQTKFLCWEWFICKVENEPHINFESWCNGTLNSLELGGNE